MSLKNNLPIVLAAIPPLALSTYSIISILKHKDSFDDNLFLPTLLAIALAAAIFQALRSIIPSISSDINPKPVALISAIISAPLLFFIFSNPAVSQSISIGMSILLILALSVYIFFQLLNI